MPLAVDSLPSVAAGDAEPRLRWWRPGRLLWARVPVSGLLAAGLAWAGFNSWEAGWPWSSRPPGLPTVTVDRGDIAVAVVESGSLESANNATVRCKVEALMGITTGRSGGAGSGAAGGSGGSGGGGRGGSSACTSTSSSASARTGSATTNAARTGTTGNGTGTGKSTGTGNATTDSTQAPGSAAGGQERHDRGRRRGRGRYVTTIWRPVIQSFMYKVTPHVPVRPQLKSEGTSTVAASGAGGGGGGSGDGSGERPGPPAS